MNTLKQYYNYFKLCWLSLTYNNYGSKLDTMIEPIFSISHFALLWFGPIFVFLVISLTSSVVYVFYSEILPYLSAVRSTFRLYITAIYGHYLLLMIIFNYYYAVTTNPGAVPKDMKGMVSTSVCKRCVSPKPQRSHHCSVCKKCILKMDHHCPWLNNCVGHFNHRYFICFCTYMMLGTIFVSLTVFPLFYHCFQLRNKIYRIKKAINGYFDLFNITTTGPIEMDLTKTYLSNNEVNSHHIIYLFLLCFSVTVALGGLTFWHMYLISRGETSIEKLINCKEKNRLKRLNLKFVNVYNYGPVLNWQLLLGFKNKKCFVRRVLLPSKHKPYCNGINWKIPPKPVLPFTA